ERNAARSQIRLLAFDAKAGRIRALVETQCQVDRVAQPEFSTFVVVQRRKLFQLLGTSYQIVRQFEGQRSAFSCRILHGKVGKLDLLFGPGLEPTVGNAVRGKFDSKRFARLDCSRKPNSNPRTLLV